MISSVNQVSSCNQKMIVQPDNFVFQYQDGYSSCQTEWDYEGNQLTPHQFRHQENAVYAESYYNPIDLYEEGKVSLPNGGEISFVSENGFGSEERIASEHFGSEEKHLGNYHQSFVNNEGTAYSIASLSSLNACPSDAREYNLNKTLEKNPDSTRKRDVCCQCGRKKVKPSAKVLKERRVAAALRERRRLKILNEAYDRLREILPTSSGSGKKLFKHDIIKLAKCYIISLQELVNKNELS